MIIVGDIASPSKRHSDLLGDFFIENAHVFQGNKLICNLEGLILSEKGSFVDNTPVLYNHPSVIETLIDANICGVGLANNHTLDLPHCFKETKKLLISKDVPFSGAGESKLEAEKSFSFYEGETEVTVFNFCWDFLLYHQNNPQDGIYIAELDELTLINKVKGLKEAKPDAKILVYIHWSFDLENLPFPMYRQFSQLLIDAGVSVVAGCHSHCVQGGEKYKNGYIVYGLGNFFIPHNIYAGGSLSFPKMSSMQLAFEYNFLTKEAKCHWFEYDETHKNFIKYIKSESFEESEILEKYSPYSKLDDRNYLKYFKQYRRKKLLVPIYKSIYNVKRNYYFTKWLKARATFLRLLSKYKIRGWQN